MGYSWKTRVGYHQVDRNRKLTLTEMINMFQDCGGFHGADVNFSNQQMADLGLAWIISSWQVAVNEMPDLDSHVVVETYPYKLKYCVASRYYALVSPDGFEYARANSLWVLMDMKEYKPVKVSKEIWEAYAPYEDIFKGFDFGGRKIVSEGEGKTLEKIEVSPYMIDTNAHVNNEQYIRLAQCLLPQDLSWNRFRAEYTKQAKLGDILVPVLFEQESGVQVALLSEEGEQFFIGEWAAETYLHQ